MTFYHITLKSANAKTGPIPVSTISANTCPDICPFKKGGCYAKSGPLALHWGKVNDGTRGTDLAGYIETIANFPTGQLWRHAQAGDLPGDGETIDGDALGEIVRANIGLRGFTYTHYSPAIGENAKFIRGANEWGFTVNLSANNLDHADKLANLKIGPVVTVLPADSTENTFTPMGRRVVICPATIRDGVSCATCQLCARQRDIIVGFPAHGTGKKLVEKTIQIFRG